MAIFCGAAKNSLRGTTCSRISVTRIFMIFETKNSRHFRRIMKKYDSERDLALAEPLPAEHRELAHAPHYVTLRQANP
jgi:hypothetical protein